MSDPKASPTGIVSQQVNTDQILTPNTAGPQPNIITHPTHPNLASVNAAKLVSDQQQQISSDD